MKPCCLLLCMNFKMEARMWIKLIFEILIIIGIFMFIIANPMPQEGTRQDDKNSQKMSLKLSNLRSMYKLDDDAFYSLAYSPDNEGSDFIARNAAALLGINSTLSFSNAETMHHSLKPTFFAGLDVDMSPEHLALELSFPEKLRSLQNYHEEAQNYWATHSNSYEFGHKILATGENAEEFDAQSDAYFSEGFAQLQHFAFRLWYDSQVRKARQLLKHSGNANEGNNDFNLKNGTSRYNLNYFTGNEEAHLDKAMELRAFRHYSCDNTGEGTFYDLFYSFVFLLPFCNLNWKFGRLTEEDVPYPTSRRGISFGCFWLIHFVTSILHLILLEIIIIVVVKIKWFDDAVIFADTEYYNLVLFFIVYDISFIITSMVIVHGRRNAKDAVLVGIVIWLINYCIFGVYLYRSKHEVTFWRYIPMLVFFNNGFGYSMHILRHHSFEPMLIYANCAALLGNALISLMILSLIHRKKPGLHATGKKSKCSPCCKRKKKNSSNIDLPLPLNFMDNFESGPYLSTVAIHTKNATTYTKKPYGKEPHIKVLTLKIYMGEITVLLGPNDSGKTDMLCLLAGLKKPEHGWVYHFKTDIYRYPKKVAGLSDVLMPSNCLMDLLTVRETLVYVVHLKSKQNKNMAKNFMSLEVRKWERYLEDIIDNQRKLVKKLDYDQKRLLALCCCLACNTKLVFFDQPTEHMRWREQRMFWDLLKIEKKNRAIVLTTCEVNEAEQIADRIAVLNDGIILAYGSQFYLKTVFGTEDQLVILTDNSADVDQITKYLQAFIPKLSPENEIANQIYYNIPYTYRSKYQKILIELERDQRKLGILNIYMMASELKDIYMRLALDANKILPHQQLTGDLIPEFQRVSDRKVCLQQMRATSEKKLLYQSPALVMLGVLLVSIFVIPLLYYMYDLDHNAVIVSGNRIHFGFTEGMDRTLIKNYSDCDYVEIRQLPIFTNDTLKCGYGDFVEKLNEREFDASDLYGVVEANRERLKGWFNARKFHSVPVVLNLMHNLAINDLPNNYFTSVMSNPFGDKPRNIIWGPSMRLPESTHLQDIIVPVMVGIMMTFVIAFTIVELANERNSNIMDMYEIAGLNMDAFWFINFLWDFFTYITNGLLFTILITIFSMFNNTFLQKMFTYVIFMVYSAAILPNIYVFSLFRYKSAYRAYLYMMLYMLVTGSLLFMIYVYALYRPDYFPYAGMIFSNFAVLMAVNRLFHSNTNQDFKRLFEMEEPSLVIPMIYLFAEFVFWFLVLCVIHDYRKSVRYKKRPNLKLYRTVIDPREDPDVIALKKKIASYSRAECLTHRITVDQLEGKLRKDTRKLDTVSFFLNKHEILCVRGPARSGKTQLARQLAGLDPFHFGEVYVCKFDLSLDTSKVHSFIGYCPQQFGLLESLTVAQMLRMFYLIRGLPPKLISGKMRQLSLLLNIHRYLNIRISKLNVGTKRKVSIAVACVVFNKVLILDEPTRGLPLNICREIWNTLRYMRFLGMTIVVITRDSYECQVLSDKVMIFRNHSVLAYNSPVNLIRTYTTHLVIDIRLGMRGSTPEEIEINMQKDIDNLRRFARYMHEYSVLVSRMDSWIKFYIPVKNIRFSYVWGALEKNRQILNISEYNTSICTLDTIADLLLKTKKEHRPK